MRMVPPLPSEISSCLGVCTLRRFIGLNDVLGPEGKAGFEALLAVLRGNHAGPEDSVVFEKQGAEQRVGPDGSNEIILTVGLNPKTYELAFAWHKEMLFVRLGFFADGPADSGGWHRVLLPADRLEKMPELDALMRAEVEAASLLPERDRPPETMPGELQRISLAGFLGLPADQRTLRRLSLHEFEPLGRDRWGGRLHYLGEEIQTHWVCGSDGWRIEEIDGKPAGKFFQRRARHLRMVISKAA